MANSNSDSSKASRKWARPLSDADDVSNLESNRPGANGSAPLNPTDLYLTTRLTLGANDSPIDDFLELAEQWEHDTGQSVFPHLSISPESASHDHEMSCGDALDQIAKQFSAPQMRRLGESMLKLADALDQAWNPAAVRSQYHWITRAGKIEKQALALAKVAVLLRENSKRRARYIEPEFVAEPAWQMLLELFIQFAGGAEVSTKSLCIVSGVPDTTALRLIEKMESSNLIKRSQSLVDKRVTLARLTRDGVVAVGSFLMEVDR